MVAFCSARWEIHPIAQDVLASIIIAAIGNVRFHLLPAGPGISRKRSLC